MQNIRAPQWSQCKYLHAEPNVSIINRYMNENIEPQLNKEGGLLKFDEEIAESQKNMSELIREVDKISRFEVIEEGEKKYIISKEGERYQVLRLNEGDKEDLKIRSQELHDFNTDFFEEEENDRPEDYETALSRNLSDFYAILDSEDKIVALLNTQLLRIKKDVNKPLNLSLNIWYVATKKEHRQRGLATELYRAAYNNLLGISKKEKSPIFSIVGETEDAVEKYLYNAFGRRRMYFEHDDGSVEEVPYCAPPSWEDQEPTPEHFMMRLINGQSEVNVPDFLKIIRGIFSEYTRDDYAEVDTEEGRQQYNELVEQTYANLEQAIVGAKNGRLFLLGPKERTQKKSELEKTGKKFIEIKK